MTLATLPTTRDEAWRYASSKGLAALTPEALDNWKEIELAAGETRRHALVLDDQHAGVHRVRLTLGEGARAELFAVLTGGEYTRLEVEVRLARGAHFELGGVTLGGSESTREIVTRLDHAEPEATSNQVVRSVHWGKGTGNFLGTIEVARDAQKTDAAQSFKGLLLEKGASVNAVPQLEIFADDVKCAHGASVGQLDEMARYYMATRGLSPELSRRLLVQAFIGDALVGLADDEAAHERLLRVALDKLDRHL